MRTLSRLNIACALALATAAAHAADLEVTVSGLPAADGLPAVVWLVPSAGRVPTRAAGTAIIDQINKQFVPRVSIVETGTAVSFPNKDNIRHHVYSFSPAKPFELKLYSGKPSNPVTFDRPGVVTLGCNIHDVMLGYVVVVDTPWHALTDARGVAHLQDLPAGDYLLHAWLPGDRPGERAAQPLHVAASGDGPQRVSFVPASGTL